MDHAARRAPVEGLPLDLLPELPTRIGMAGAMRHAEVAGSSCTESGIIIATIVFNITDR